MGNKKLHSRNDGKTKHYRSRGIVTKVKNRNLKKLAATPFPEEPSLPHSTTLQTILPSQTPPSIILPRMINETETEPRRLFEEYRIKDFKVLIASLQWQDSSRIVVYLLRLLDNVPICAF